MLLGPLAFRSGKHLLAVAIHETVHRTQDVGTEHVGPNYEDSEIGEAVNELEASDAVLEIVDELQLPIESVRYFEQHTEEQLAVLEENEATVYLEDVRNPDIEERNYILADPQK